MSVSLYGSGQTVIQVVGATTTTQTSTSSTTPVTTGLTASITPQATTSKVLVTVTLNGCQNGSSAVCYVTLFRGATNLGAGTPATTGVWYPTNTGLGNITFSYLDSPSTTSSTTYTAYFWASSGTSTISNNNCVSSIQLLEISGA
jgi:hypothetical protein